MRIHLLHDPVRLRGSRTNHLDLGPREESVLELGGREVALEAIVLVENGELVLVTLHPDAARRGVVLAGGPLVIPPGPRPTILSLMLAAGRPLTISPGEPLARLVVLSSPMESLRHDPVLPDEMDGVLPGLLVESLLEDDSAERLFAGFRLFGDDEPAER